MVKGKKPDTKIDIFESAIQQLSKEHKSLNIRDIINSVTKFNSTGEGNMPTQEEKRIYTSLITITGGITSSGHYRS